MTRCFHRSKSLRFASLVAPALLAATIASERVASAEDGTELAALIAAEQAYERGVDLISTKPEEAKDAFEKAAS